MPAGIIAIFSALFFALNNVSARRAVVRASDATTGALLSIPIGVAFFLIVLLVGGQISRVAGFSWPSYLWLLGAGIVHFVIGRSLTYNCFKLCGVNIGLVLIGTYPLVAAILGVGLLREPMDWQLAVGVLLIVGGVITTMIDPKQFRKGVGSPFRQIPRLAILFGLGTGLAWGISPIMIKLGLQGSPAGSSIAAALISYCGALIPVSWMLFRGSRKTALFTMERGGLGYYSLAAIFVATGQLLRYTALEVAPASVVAPLMSTSPIFQVILAFLFNRKLEVFNSSIIVGTILVVIGSILVV